MHYIIFMGNLRSNEKVNTFGKSTSFSEILHKICPNRAFINEKLCSRTFFFFFFFFSKQQFLLVGDFLSF